MPIANQYSMSLCAYHYWKHKTSFLLPSDRYRNWAMFVVEEGSFQYKINSVSNVAVAGDAVICPPDTDFERYIDNTKLTFHFIIFDWRTTTEDFELQLRSSIESAPEHKLRFSDSERFTSTLSHLRNLESKISLLDFKCKEHFINELGVMFYMQTLEKETFQQAKEDPIMIEIKAILEKLAYDRFHLKSIGEQFHMNSVQLTRRFHASYGMNPMEYVTALRMKKAKMLLTSTEYTLDHIAQLCGYDNGFYFSRAFLKHVGMNPSLYRKTHIV